MPFFNVKRKLISLINIPKSESRITFCVSFLKTEEVEGSFRCFF